MVGSPVRFSKQVPSQPSYKIVLYFTELAYFKAIHPASKNRDKTSGKMQKQNLFNIHSLGVGLNSAFLKSRLP